MLIRDDVRPSVPITFASLGSAWCANKSKEFEREYLAF